jgi:hypothetical protein
VSYARRGRWPAAAVVAVAAATASVGFLSHGSGAEAAAPTFKYGLLDRAAIAGDAGPLSPTTTDKVSRRVRTSVPGASEWVRSGDGQICVIGDAPNTTSPNEVAPAFACAATANLASSGGLLTLTAEGTDTGTGRFEYSIIGVAPDGVKEVQATLPDGTVQTAPVSQNGFQLEADQEVESVNVVAQGQSYTVALEGK